MLFVYFILERSWQVPSSQTGKKNRNSPKVAIWGKVSENFFPPIRLWCHLTHTSCLKNKWNPTTCLSSLPDSGVCAWSRCLGRRSWGVPGTASLHSTAPASGTQLLELFLRAPASARTGGITASFALNTHVGHFWATLVRIGGWFDFGLKLADFTCLMPRWTP